MFDLHKSKLLIIAALIGLLIFTACDEDTKKTDNETLFPTAAKFEDAIDFNEINISGIKIKNLSTGQESILIKDGIVREFREFIKEMNFIKTNEDWAQEYEAEILESGESVLKIVFSGRAIWFNERVKIGNTVLESGAYKLDEWISDNIKHFYEGEVLDPQHIEMPSYISMPENIYNIDMFDRGSGKINLPEVFTKSYIFVEENILNQKYELVHAEKIFNNEAMELKKQQAMKNCRALVLEIPISYFNVDSDSGYKQLVYASNSVIVAENLENPGIYRLFTERMIVDFKVNDQFIKGFEDIFNTNANESKNLTPDEIETLFNEKSLYYMEYICKNLNIEKWRGREPNGLKKHKMVLNNQEGPYTVLEFYDDYELRLLFFKDNKFIDYIDYGHKFAGTEYRIEKAGNKIFIAGRKNRGYGTGVDENFEEWYLLNDKGKKLVIGFPYNYFNQTSLWGYELTANNIQFNASNNMSLIVDYNIRKFYGLDIDIADEYGYVTIEGKKRVIFKWDDEKSVFVSDYDKNEMGMFEIPPESDDITEKCTKLLKQKYQQLLEIVSSPIDIDEFNAKYIKDSWRDFLNSCMDCEEKFKLLEIIGNIKE